MLAQHFRKPGHSVKLIILVGRLSDTICVLEQLITGSKLQTARLITDAFESCEDKAGIDSLQLKRLAPSADEWRLMPRINKEKFACHEI